MNKYLALAPSNIQATQADRDLVYALMQGAASTSPLGKLALEYIRDGKSDDCEAVQMVANFRRAEAALNSCRDCIAAPAVSLAPPWAWAKIALLQERSPTSDPLELLACYIAADESVASALLEIAERILERGYVSSVIDEERGDHADLTAAIARARGAHD